MAWSNLFRRNKHSEIENIDASEAATEQCCSSDSSCCAECSGNSDRELVAIITAAIQAYLGTNGNDKLVIRSYRRIQPANPVWNRASLNDQLVQF